MADKSFSINVNMKGLAKYMQIIPHKLKKARRDSLEESALKVQNRAKTLSPVLTGHLRRSITHEIKRDMAQVGTDVEYAEVQEYKNRTKPDGYLRPALTDSAKDIEKIFAKNIEKALK